MPHRVWKHQCKKGGPVVWQGTDVCEDCGRRGIPAGWSRSIFEMMGAYQRRTGLKPIGPHRPLADELLGRLTRRCQACASQGLLDAAQGEGWRDCPACDGLGAYLVGTAAEIAEAQRRILEAFPDAATG